MPEPSRPPWQIVEGLGGWPFWSLIEQRVTVVIECDSCPHFAKWTPADMQRKCARNMSRTFARIAPRLRCSRCKSNWLRVSLDKGSFLAGKGTP